MMRKEIASVNKDGQTTNRPLMTTLVNIGEPITITTTTTSTSTTITTTTTTTTITTTT